MPKSKINGYVLYITEMKRQISHWSNKSIPELINLASADWNALSQKEKDNYNQRAKEMRGVEPGAGGGAGAAVSGGAKDSLGRSLKLLQKRDQDEQLEKKKKISDVDNLVQDTNGNLEDKVFYVMHADVFAKFTALSEKDESVTWVPAEIAVSKFSLRSGLIEAYQAFPLPGLLPTGSKWECLQKAEKIQIPLTPEESGFNKTDLEIVSDLQAFLGSTKMVFVMPEMEDQVRGVLDKIYQRSKQPSLGLTFLELNRLFFKLRTAVCKTEEEAWSACPSENIALNELEKEKFLYSGGLGCPHHERNDTAKCCQTMLASWIFTVLDSCCPAFNIQIIPGVHSPAAAEPIKAVTWKAASAKRSSGVMSLTESEDGLFASEDIRYKESSGSSVSSGSSYQRYVDSVEVDTDTQDGVSTAEENSSDQEDKASSGMERRLSLISISSGLTNSRASVISGEHSMRRSLGRGSLMDRLKRNSATVRPGSTTF